jgi:hypothetical protein
LAETGWKPESMPRVGVVNMVQGSVKLDWVTVYKKGIRCAVEEFNGRHPTWFPATLPGQQVNLSHRA